MALQSSLRAALGDRRMVSSLDVMEIADELHAAGVIKTAEDVRALAGPLVEANAAHTEAHAARLCERAVKHLKLAEA